MMKSLFVSIPHSGEKIPAEVDWLSDLAEPVVMCDVDRYVDRLYAPAIEALSIPAVIADWHRYAVDLNRFPDDVDERSVVGLSGGRDMSHLASGLHWTKTTKGDVLMPQPMSADLHKQLVKSYYHPFHQKVRDQFQSIKQAGHAKAFHLDLHSMPSMGTSAHVDPGQMRPEVVVSDLHGVSAEPWFKDLVIDSLKDAGLEVAYNFPYKGGRVTEIYGDPSIGQNTIQIELSRALYMDENSKQLIAEKAKSLQQKLTAAMTTIANKLEQDQN